MENQRLEIQTAKAYLIRRVIHWIVQVIVMLIPSMTLAKTYSHLNARRQPEMLSTMRRSKFRKKSHEIRTSSFKCRTDKQRVVVTLRNL